MIEKRFLTFCTLTLAALCALLMITVRPAKAQTEKVLYNFANSPDGANPQSSLTYRNGNFYGTTENGGLGDGTVFELSPNGSGGWNETVLYSFCSAAGCTDGSNPFVYPLVFDSAGNLYGATFSSSGVDGEGIVFELSPAGTSWTETVVPVGGVFGPIDLIMDPVGNLYGADSWASSGSVFELSPSGGGWAEQGSMTTSASGAQAA